MCYSLECYLFLYIPFLLRVLSFVPTDYSILEVLFLLFFFFFFFSSRRRHTRFDCDWSSDVCSSDLSMPENTPMRPSWPENSKSAPNPFIATSSSCATGWNYRSNLIGRATALTTRDRKERRVGKECRSRWSPYH